MLARKIFGEGVMGGVWFALGGVFGALLCALFCIAEDHVDWLLKEAKERLGR